MTIQSLPARHRVAVYDYVKSRRLHHQEHAYELLGERCAICGSKDELRLRFLDSNHPLKMKYAHSPATLYRRLCYEPNLRQEVRLLCRLCRLEGKQPTIGHQAIKPLDDSQPYEGMNGN
jgi:hypothetical protein